MNICDQLQATATLFPPPSEISPGTRWVEGWLGPRGGLAAMEKKRNLPSLQDIELHSSAVKP